MSLVTLEVPYGEVDPELLDPDFPRRAKILADLEVGRPVISRPIVRIGHIQDKAKFSQPLEVPEDFYTIHYELDVNAAVACYTFPEEISQFSEAFSIFARHQHGAGYSTAKTGSARVMAWQSFLKADWEHIDPVPHRDKPPFLNIWWQNYLVADKGATLSFPTEEPKYPRFAVRREAMEEKPEQLGDYDAGFMSHTGLHASPPMLEDGVRTFLKVFYAHNLPEKFAK